MSPFSRGSRDKGQPPVALPLLSADQVTAMPLAELGTLVLPVWAAGEGTPSYWRDGDAVPGRLAAALTGQPQPVAFRPSRPFAGPHAKAIAEAIQDLVRAGLLLRTHSMDSGSFLTITRLGERALVESTVTHRLHALGE